MSWAIDLVTILAAGGLVVITFRLARKTAPARPRVKAPKSLAPLAAAMEQTLDCVLLADWSGALLYASSRACSHLRLQRSQVLGARIDALASSPDSFMAAWRLARILQGPMAPFKTVLKRSDGRSLLAEMTFSILDRRGSGLILASFVPLRQNGEKPLACPSAERFRRLADELPVAIFEAQADGSYSYVNDRYAEIHSKIPKELLGHNWASMIHPEDREFVMTLWQDAVGSKSSYSAEYRILASDGSIKWVICSAEPRGRGRKSHSRPSETRFLGFLIESRTAGKERVRPSGEVGVPLG